MTSPQCITCVHFRIATGTCKAFPKRIPTKIITGEHDHRKPFKGDNGIRWEPYKPDEGK